MLPEEKFMEIKRDAALMAKKKGRAFHHILIFEWRFLFFFAVPCDILIGLRLSAYVRLANSSLSLTFVGLKGSVNE